jgi:processive 1,2-diacylglycerol beta-glucosyltransferase
VKNKRILILSASVGSGHVKAAEALAKSFRARPEVEEVLVDDSLDHTNVLHKQLYSTLYKRLSAVLPEFLGWWYVSSDDPWVSDRSRLALDLPQALPLVNPSAISPTGHPYALHARGSAFVPDRSGPS